MSGEGQIDDVRCAPETATIAPAPIVLTGLLTPEQLAERWQLSKAAVYRLTREGKVPVVRLGKRYRYRIGAIEEFEAAGGAK